MRQLKDASSVSNPMVKLLYRIRRKHSGYIWIEASGKLHSQSPVSSVFLYSHLTNDLLVQSNLEKVESVSSLSVDLEMCSSSTGMKYDSPVVSVISNIG